MNRGIIFLLLIVLNSFVVISGEETINQHTTDIVRDAMTRINAHTDDKIQEQTDKANQMIAETETKINDVTRNASVKMFIALTSAIVFGGSIVLLIMNFYWKKYAEILPLCNLDDKRKDARLWVLEQKAKGFGNWNIKKQLKKSLYSKKDINMIMTEVQ